MLFTVLTLKHVEISEYNSFKPVLTNHLNIQNIIDHNIKS